MDEFSKCIATTSNNDLPYELIIEILLRLPVKSLLKMRSVSKSWLSLISSPLFVRSHLEFSAKNREFPNHRLLFLKSSVKYTCSLAAAICNESRCIPVELDFACEGPFPKICTIWGSCDGLFCISSVSKELFLWNPSIKKLKKLPPSLNDVGYGTYGLGYVECVNDYRILEIRGECSTVFRNVVNVYSLRTNSWKRIRRYAGVSFGDQPGILVNGILHHKAYRGDCFISSFNFVDEIFGDVALPNPALFGDVALLNPSEFNWRLGTLGGNLCVYSHPADATDVWVMMEYGLVESWIKVFSIPSYLIVRPIFLPGDENFLLLRRRSKLRWYNSRDNTFSHPDENKIWCDASTTFHLYIESLVSPSFPEEVEELRINE